ncbi:MAG: tetraacyldisaccharide 4'-kinase [Longimicrobiales bacterium]
MARSLEGWVRRWWRGEAGWGGRIASVTFWPAERLFRWAAAARNLAYDHDVLPVTMPSVPVLSVGNLTVGGTGKTPVVRWFVGALQQGGAAPGVVARGYGRDEILLHRRWYPRTPVAAHPDRVRALDAAVGAGADVVVLDDGFQHRRLGRTRDVVLLAAEPPFPGRRLPRGPYREGPDALGRADLVVVTRKTASPEAAAAVAGAVRRRHPGVPVARAALLPGPWRGVDGGPAPAPEGPAEVITAVAEPEGVRALAARTLGRPEEAVELTAFPDHHEFTEGEAREMARRGTALVVTEKDAVKLAQGPVAAALGDRRVHVLTLDLAWEEGRELADAAVARILRARTAGAGR